MAILADPMPSYFGTRLRALRQERKLTQAALGEAAGIPRTIIARLERLPVVNPTLDTMTKLADVLGVGIEAFVPPKEESASTRTRK